LKRKSVRPKKRLGQNFLYDPAIAEKIVSAAEPGAGEVVVELGAGRGILTRALLARGARLIALELDSALFAILSADLAGSGSGTASGNAESGLELLNVDFTSVELGELLAEREVERCMLMGNIPYYLTREVLFGFLVDEHRFIDRAFIMVQKEVGDRIVSPPGSRTYGITSVILQTLYDVKTVMKVAPGSFFPPPKVASVVLGFRSLPEPLLGDHEWGPFQELVKNLFQQRRKTIHNTLRAFYGLSQDRLEALAAASGVDLGARPEALAKEDFHRLTRGLLEVGNG
jgi:16S rRNA (adenine1518-N6/adenine1519-N6)-dimethyltransferase